MITIVVAVFILIISSLFLAVQTMPKLYKLNATGKKFFWQILIFFLVAPCVILVLYYIINKYETNIWISGPTLFIFLVWLFTGFIAKAIHQTLTVENPRRKRVTFTPEDIRKRYKQSALLYVLAVAMWLFGFFHGFGQFDTAFVILFIYFVLQGTVNIFGNRKAIADGNVKTAQSNTSADEANKADE